MKGRWSAGSLFRRGTAAHGEMRCRAEQLGGPWLSQQLALALDRAPRRQHRHRRAGQAGRHPRHLPRACQPPVRHRSANMGDANSNGVLQVVSGDGAFNTDGLQTFVRDSGVEGSGVGYTIVAITGPQSSGKSTLLNHLVRSGGWRGGGGGALRASSTVLPASPLLTSHDCTTPRCSLARGSRRWTRSAGATRRRAASGWPAPPRCARRCRGGDRCPFNLTGGSALFCQSARLPSHTR